MNIKHLAVTVAYANAEWGQYSHVFKYEVVEAEIARLERELAECKDNLHKVSLDWQAQAFKVLQMREAIEHAVKKCGCGGVSVPEREALSLDTKPAESVINAVKAHALREAADEFGKRWTVAGKVQEVLHIMANELENK